MVVAGLISIQLVSCKNFSAKQTWHKGNLHTHSLWSDGDDFPEMIIQWYKDNDYQFIALSDHNTIGDSEFWYEIRQREVKNKTLEMEGIHFKINSNESISVTYEKNSLNFGEIINYLSQNNIKILDIITEDGDLEDVFIQLTNR